MIEQEFGDNKGNTKSFAFPSTISWSHKASVWLTTRLPKALESQNVSSNLL